MLNFDAMQNTKQKLAKKKRKVHWKKAIFVLVISWKWGEFWWNQGGQLTGEVQHGEVFTEEVNCLLHMEKVEVNCEGTLVGPISGGDSGIGFTKLNWFCCKDMKVQKVHSHDVWDSLSCSGVALLVLFIVIPSLKSTTAMITFCALKIFHF